MLLTRTSDGRLSNNGQQIVLRGGHCHLFSAVFGDRALLRGGQDFLVPFPVAGFENDWCKTVYDLPEGGNLAISKWGAYTAFLDRLQAAECNLTRVFLSNGVEVAVRLDQPDIHVTSLHPFVRSGDRWRVAAAIRDRDPAAWSADYFQRLTSFVRAADQRGIAVQLCLFTYHDFLPTVEPFFRYWPESFWNASNADDTDWGRAYLLPENGAPPHLNLAFMDLANGNLMSVQKAYVERVLAAVAGSGNVILELMNEPRIARQDDPPAANRQGIMAAWLNTVAGWIVDALARPGAGPRHLISANASYPVNGELPPTPSSPPTTDVDAWAALPASSSRYRELDLVSYHGLTGVANAASDCGTAPQVDLPAIQARIARHKNAHGSKALMFSTDAVGIGPLKLRPPGGGAPITADRSDGHLRTNIGYSENLDPKGQRTRHDLDNWAFQTLREGVKAADLGRVHFQNHSTYERSFTAIRDAWRAATGVGGPGGVAWQGPYVGVTGGANHQNFWWAHHRNSANGELVNQFHTENGAGSAASAAGESEIGWRFDLTGSGAPLRLSAAYDLVSVSEIEDPQATVEQRLRLVVSLLVGGQPGPTPAGGIAERVVQRGQSGPGSLEVLVTLAPGQPYRVTATTRVAISYQNKTKVGYGETIVRFPSLVVG